MTRIGLQNVPGTMASVMMLSVCFAIKRLR
jgi:hypothetical protein